jgi:hypothetical protein
MKTAREHIEDILDKCEDEEPEAEEPEEYHYETDTEKLADRGLRQSDFI